MKTPEKIEKLKEFEKLLSKNLELAISELRGVLMTNDGNIATRRKIESALKLLQEVQNPS